MNAKPVTNHDFTPAAAVERLEWLLAQPPLTLTVQGGGLEESQRISPETVFIVSRAELKHLVWLLKRVEWVGLEESDSE